MAPPPTETRQAERSAWYHQPVMWLGLAILLASAAGCIVMIMLGAGSDRVQPAASEGDAVFGVPLRAPQVISEAGRANHQTPVAPQR